MTLNQLKNILHPYLTAYWRGATVAWGATNKVKPLAPLVILRPGTVTRAAQPVTQMINGIVFSAYPSELPLQVDLFTKGHTVDEARGQYAENTAVSDLLDFINYLDSPATVEWSNRHDIGISLYGGVQDLSEVINNSQWQYRAMAEIRLTFTQWAAEYNGVLNESAIIFDSAGMPVDIDAAKWRQTASGGGTQELADATTGFFNETPKITQEDFTDG